MSIIPIGGGVRAAYSLQPPRAAAPAAPAAPAVPARPAAPSAPSRPVAPAIEMPAGSDPQLWSVLTNEEKQFFLQQQSLGAVTYGRGASPARAAALAPAPLGLRVDVRA